MLYRLRLNIVVQRALGLTLLCLALVEPAWSQGATANADAAATASLAASDIPATPTLTAADATGAIIPVVPAIEDESATATAMAQPIEEMVDYGVPVPAYASFEEGLDLLRKAFLMKEYPTVLALNQDLAHRYTDKPIPNYYSVRARINLARLEKNKDSKKPYRHLQDLPPHQPDKKTTATEETAPAQGAATEMATATTGSTETLVAAVATKPTAPNAASNATAPSPAPAAPEIAAAPPETKSGIMLGSFDLGAFIQEYKIFLIMGAAVLVLLVILTIMLRRWRGKNADEEPETAGSEQAPEPAAAQDGFGLFSEPTGNTTTQLSAGMDEITDDIFAGSILDTMEKPIAETGASEGQKTNWELEQETIEDFVPPTSRIAPAAPVAPAIPTAPQPPEPVTFGSIEEMSFERSEPLFSQDEPFNLLGDDDQASAKLETTTVRSDASDLIKFAGEEAPLASPRETSIEDEPLIAESYISLMKEANESLSAAPMAGSGPLVLPNLGEREDETPPSTVQSPHIDEDLLSVDTETLHPVMHFDEIAPKGNGEQIRDSSTSPTQTYPIELGGPGGVRKGASEETLDADGDDEDLLALSLDQTLPSWDENDPEATLAGDETHDLPLLMEEPEREIQEFHRDETVAIHLPEAPLEEGVGQAATVEQTRPMESPLAEAMAGGGRGGDLFAKTLRQGLEAFNASDWDSAVHHLSIATALDADSSEAREKLREARRRRRG